MKEGWRSATLAEKIPNGLARAGQGPVRRFLGREAAGLHVEWSCSLEKNWLRVQARGEDSEAFLNLLTARFGEAPVQHSKVERWDVLRGFVTGAGKVGFGVYVDVGILEPASKDGLYPLHRMRAQLADGALISCRDILAENSLVDDFPLRIVVSNVENGKVDLELADETRDLLLSWRKFPFDRVLSVGVEKEDVERAIAATGLQYDIIKIESLSPFVHSLVCKIGTESPGVISKIGNRLKGVGLASYRSKLKMRVS